MTMPSLQSIRAARDLIRRSLAVTPVLSSTFLAGESGAARLHLKCESLQKTGSFKVRGALNAVSQLDAAARSRGVVAVSAGNHAQAVAWAARSLGVRSTVVMPATASESKAAASAGYGAEVIRHGTGAEAFVRAQELAEEHGFTFIHPFDDMRVVTGAASVGIEIMEQVPDAEVVVVPIGGGGLISGVASGIKQSHPHVHIIGVEPEGAASMRQSLDEGHPVRLTPNTIADGLASPFAGEIAFGIVKEAVDDVVVVSDKEIAAAMGLVLSRTKLLAEPAGAAATAALLAHRIPAARGAKVVSILSGGNVDLERLKTLI